MMETTWIIVAASGHCRCFEAGSRIGPLTEVADLVMPASRLREQELVSDRPGRVFDSFGSGRHAMEPRTPPKEIEGRRFAAEIVGMLEAARQQGRFDRLGIVAAPAFLGMLRDALGSELRKLVAFEIDKDLTRQRPDEIRGLLPERL